MVAHQRSLLGWGEPRVSGDAVDRSELGGGAWVEVGRGWLAGADTLLDDLIASVEWEHSRRRMYDRVVDDPRLHRRYEVAGAFQEHALPHRALADIRDALARHYGVALRSIALNYYRDGRDSVAFHRDRELRHLDDTLVIIVTLGSRRPFLIRPLDRSQRSIDLAPASGDLLVMGGTCQQRWEHGVPKVVRAGPRISVTLRWARAPS